MTTLADTHRPTAGTVEDRRAPVGDTLTVDGPRLRGRIPYGVESRDMGGWREVIEPGALSGAKLDDLVATVDHAGVPIGRHPRTLELEDRTDALHWSVELPESRSDVREAVERGDLRSGSWRMIVGRDEWRGEVRHVHSIAELRDVAVVTVPAYTASATEYRAAPEQTAPEAAPAATNTPSPQEGRPMQTEDRQQEAAPTAGLVVEDRTAQVEQRTIEQRVATALRSVRKGETRSLDTVNADPITPTEQATVLFDALRASSIALASGLLVIPTTRESIAWPQLVTSVDPSWVAEGALIPVGDPVFAELKAVPRKLAHRVVFSNEVADDSEPAIIDVLNQHLALMLGLKLDLAIFEGNAANGIRGLKFTPGIQTISMGTNGAPLTSYAPLVRAVGRLRSANVPPPYAIAAHPDVLTELELLEDADGNQKARPATLPPIYTSSLLSTTETAGTSTTTRSAYVYSPSQLALVRRADATIEVDRSRLFDTDQSEMRGKLRADLLVPNVASVVRITGITPAA
jgi:HK97 family phage major capsid protein